MSKSKPSRGASFKPLALADGLALKSADELSEMHAFWLPKCDPVPTDEQALRKGLQGAMVQGERIRDRLGALGARMTAVFHTIL
jgi:hypothetical protein